MRAPSRSARWATALLAAAIASAWPGLGIGAAGAGTTGRPRIEVVAAENFWGSIARQLGGSRVHVTSIVTNPNADPHSYEPTARDARELATAQLVVENGIGYDPWVPKLLAADGGNPTILDVGHLLGVPDGGNPHRWYSPTDVQIVIRQLVVDYRRLDPNDAKYFASRRIWFTTVALRRYDATLAAIRTRFEGTPVGASESIFAMLAPALGLDLITPPAFLTAISEGTDVSAADKETIDRQIRTRQIKIYVYNSQNVTPDVKAQLELVKTEHIPSAMITETLTPPTASYQAWQTKELLGIQAALARAASGSG